MQARKRHINRERQKEHFNVFENIRKSGIIAIGLKDSDELVRAQFTNGKNDIFF